MTKQEFIESYAYRSDMTAQELEANGLKAYPCDCGDKLCEGWQMQTEETAPPSRNGN